MFRMLVSLVHAPQASSTTLGSSGRGRTDTFS